MLPPDFEKKSLVAQGWVVIEGGRVIFQDAALSCLEMWFKGICGFNTKNRLLPRVITSICKSPDLQFAKHFQVLFDP